jgi:hypothetical protein
MIKEQEGWVYMFAIAMRDAPTVAQFTLGRASADGRVEVIGEDRVLPIESDSFSDSFDGYEVHLYRYRVAQEPQLDELVYLPFLVKNHPPVGDPTSTPFPIVDRCEDNDSCRTAGTCVLGPDDPPFPNTTIYPDDDEDWFETTELQPGEYVLRMIPPSGRDYDLDLGSILDQSQNVCPLADPGGWTPGDATEEIRWLQQQPRRFVVRVRASERDRRGDAHRPYRLSLEYVGSAPTLTPTPTPTPTATATAAPAPAPGSAVVVDHTSVELFEGIPDEYVRAAAALDMVFVDRSVGVNIDEGLTCLAHESTEAAPHGCRRIAHGGGAEFEVDPAVVSWSRPGGYPRDNWSFRPWESPGCDNWDGKVSCFMRMVEPDLPNLDVASFQLSYLAVDERSSINDSPGGFFHDNPDRYDVHDLERFEAEHPDTVFIYWTTSLARAIGTTVARDFNAAMRQYALDHSKPLFDVADILSHDPDGLPCFDNRDGVPYSNGSKSEDHPDDGVDLPAICQHYTTEVEGGHLGSVSAGKIRVAKAFWVLMAQLAGWDGSEAP